MTTPTYCRMCSSSPAALGSRYCRPCGVGDETPSLRVPACDSALDLLAEVVEAERRRHAADTAESEQRLRVVVEAVRAAEAHVQDLRRRRDWHYTRPPRHQAGDRVVMRGAEESGLGTVKRVDGTETWVTWDENPLAVYGEGEAGLLVPA